MASCRLVTCDRTVLNGFSANTEGGRLNRLVASCPPVESKPSSVCSDCPLPKDTIQAPITQTESNRLVSQMIQCGTYIFKSGITQEQAKEILAAKTRKRFESEGVRIIRREQEAIACATDPFNSDTRFSAFSRQAAAEVCPPIPPPPAPPARACPLTKNQKMS